VKIILRTFAGYANAFAAGFVSWTGAIASAPPWQCVARTIGTCGAICQQEFITKARKERMPDEEFTPQIRTLYGKEPGVKRRLTTIEREFVRTFPVRQSKRKN
jgi:hypothetical protein